MPGWEPEEASARRAAGFTQHAAAENLGYARTTVVAIEKGDRKVNAREIIRFARLYGFIECRFRPWYSAWRTSSGFRSVASAYAFAIAMPSAAGPGGGARRPPADRNAPGDRVATPSFFTESLGFAGRSTGSRVRQTASQSASTLARTRMPSPLFLAPHFSGLRSPGASLPFTLGWITLWQ
jgi:DNA-binding XRE family transcriptional regulator